MTVLTPPAYLQAGTYDAAKDRQYLVNHKYAPSGADPSRCRAGILHNIENWSAAIGVAGLSISISPFRAVIPNTFVANGGDYEVASLTTETRVMTASSPTLNRIDLVAIRVRDAFYSGVDNDCDVVLLQGTAVAGTPADPPVPTGYMAIWRLTLLANATTPTVTDLRHRTGVTGVPINPFPTEINLAGTFVSESRWFPPSGVMPRRMAVWNEDNAWHGTRAFGVTFGSWLLTSSTADRIIATLSVPDPGYAYRLFFSGAVWAGFDGSNGWRFVPRLGVSAGGTPVAGQGGWETRDPDNNFTGPTSVPITGYTTFDMSGAQTVSLWAQRKFGAGTQGASISSESSVTALVVPV